MTIEVHVDWQGESHRVGRLDAAERSASVSFEYATEWLQRADAFAIDPTSLPLQRGLHHGKSLFGAIQDCGPDRWARVRPLGGARPKSAVRLSDERLAIAKFPKPDDTRDIGAGEILTLTLAAQAGIRVSEHQRVKVGKQSVAVITRFDRNGQQCVPFISAASLLGLPQNV